MEKLKGPWVIINRLTGEDKQSCKTKTEALKIVEGLNAVEKSNGNEPPFAVVPRST